MSIPYDEIQPGDLSDEILNRIYNSGRSEPTQIVTNNTKIAIGSAVATDLVLGAINGQKPILFSFITGLIYVIAMISGLYLVIKAIIWLLDMIGSMMFRGAKVLCGL